MLRITANHENDKVLRLRLDGTLNPESFGDLEKICREQGDEIQLVILDLAGVNFMNEEAARMVIGLKGKLVRIVNCSPFIAALLESIERAN
jgi:anti-anti-sigma regulatory factor